MCLATLCKTGDMDNLAHSESSKNYTKHFLRVKKIWASNFSSAISTSSTKSRELIVLWIENGEKLQITYCAKTRYTHAPPYISLWSIILHTVLKIKHTSTHVALPFLSLHICLDFGQMSPFLYTWWDLFQMYGYCCCCTRSTLQSKCKTGILRWLGPLQSLHIRKSWPFLAIEDLSIHAFSALNLLILLPNERNQIMLVEPAKSYIFKSVFRITWRDSAKFWCSQRLWKQCDQKTRKSGFLNLPIFCIKQVLVLANQFLQWTILIAFRDQLIWHWLEIW